MALLVARDAPTLFIRREAYERTGLTRRAIDERLGLTVGRIPRRGRSRRDWPDPRRRWRSDWWTRRRARELGARVLRRFLRAVAGTGRSGFGSMRRPDSGDRAWEAGPPLPFAGSGRIRMTAQCLCFVSGVGDVGVGVSGPLRRARANRTRSTSSCETLEAGHSIRATERAA